MKRSTKFLIAGLSISVVLAFFLSPLASSLPDGLEKAIEKLVASGRVEEGPPPAVAPLPDYTFPGLKSKWLSTGLAGVMGTVAVFVAAFFIGKALSRKRSSSTRGREGD